MTAEDDLRRHHINVHAMTDSVYLEQFIWSIQTRTMFSNYSICIQKQPTGDFKSKASKKTKHTPRRPTKID